MAEFITVHIGELAALTTSFLWAATSTFFTIAGRQVGSVVVNRMRLLLAILLLLLAHLLIGQPLPTNIPADRLFWLSLSGVIGLVLGDAFLFQAFVLIGPRLSMLLMSLAPVTAGLTAWLFLDELLAAGQIAGILLVLAGITLVIAEGNGHGLVKLDRRTYIIGILFALGGATGQALGLVTAKQGLYGDFSALSGTLIRMVAAAITIWVFTAVRRQVNTTFRQLNDNRSAFRYILVGAIVGPFLGVTFSLIAIQNTKIGVASVLMALPPVILLPVGYYIFGERFGWQAVVGTLVAVSGVALLFLV